MPLRHARALNPIRLLLAVLLLGSLLASCGTDSDTDANVAAVVPVPASTSVATVEPTATPEPEPTATPEPEPTAAPEPEPAAEESAKAADSNSYDAPGELVVPLPLPPGEPGEIIATEELAIDNAFGHRILYHSQSVPGDDIAVSGFVVWPKGDPPEGGWPLVAWAHGTTGLGDSCAPSHNAENDALSLGLVGLGYAVVSTDYEGLGTPGLHPYVVGVSEGRGVLDSVRATQNLDLPFSERWIAFGHSQGGHAAMFTGQLWPDYAPELDLIGVVAGAPPSQMAELGDSLIGGDFQGYTVMSVAGLSASYPDLDLADVMTPDALAQVDVLETGCTGEIFDVYNGYTYEEFTAVDDVFELEDWGAALEANDTNREPVTVPLFILQGGEDEQIPVETTAALFEQLCAFEDQGPTIRKIYPGQTHGGVLTTFAAVPDLIAWTTARFAGDEAPDECG